MTAITKIFRHGNSDALRIPADFRLKSREVEIHRTGAGSLLIIDPAERERTLAALQGIRVKPVRRRRALATA